MIEKSVSGRGGLYAGKPQEYRSITAEEVGRILKCRIVLDQGERTREFILVYLGLVTGLKIKELVGLTTGGFSFATTLSGLLVPPEKPNESPTTLRVPMTRAVVAPITRFCLVHDLGIARGPYTILHKDVGEGSKRTCTRAAGVSVRWAQDTFKTMVRQAGITKPYSIASLRGLFAEIVGEVRGTDRYYVGYLLGRERYAKGFERAPSIGQLNRRVAEHFEKTLKTIGVL